MDVADKNKIWFSVLNVYAASRKAESLWKKAEVMLKESGVVYHGNRTGCSGNAMEITFDACMAGYRKFLAVGGDGTVHDVLNGIAAYIDWNYGMGREMFFSDFTIGAIPLGSGNDWVKSTGVSKNISKAVGAIVGEKIGRQDVVKASVLDNNEVEISSSYMINVGGVGLDARVCERVNYLKSQGKNGRTLYVRALLYALKRRQASLLKVECDGKQVFHGPFYSMSLGIGRYSGGGMLQTPEAVMDDGLLDMTIIPELPIHRVMKEVFKLFTGNLLTVPEIVSTKSKSIKVTPANPKILEPVEVDGEVVGKGCVKFDVLDSQINIITLDSMKGRHQ